MNIIDILASPWAILPDRLDELTRIYSKHLCGEKMDVAKLEAKAGAALARKPQGYDLVNGVAVIPIDGIIAKKMNLFTQISGGASTQLIERDFLQAMQDDDVKAIVLHADTPGGTVDGTAELAETIFNARGRKPIYTLADGLMASAGVWIGSAADKVYLSGGTTAAGSIGVVTQHVDRSERERQAGLTVTEIFAGKYKRIAGEHAPLSDEGREHLQARVDYIYSIFVDTVAKHRGTSTGDVLERMADGQMFIGQQGVDAGLADGIATLDELVQDLSALGSAGKHTGTTSQAVPRTSARSSTSVSPDTAGLSSEDLAAYEKGFAAGAAAELERINGIRDVASLPGHEALVEKFMFDGKTTAGQAASAIVEAERELRETRARARKNDAAEVDGLTPSVELDKPRPAPSTDTIKAKWESDASLRNEFAGSFDRYKAYEQRNSTSSGSEPSP